MPELSLEEDTLLTLEHINTGVFPTLLLAALEEALPASSLKNQFSDPLMYCRKRDY